MWHIEGVSDVWPLDGHSTTQLYRSVWIGGLNYFEIDRTLKYALIGQKYVGSMNIEYSTSYYIILLQCAYRGFETASEIQLVKNMLPAV